MKDDYESYELALKITDLKILSKRREDLCLTFALQCTKNPKTQSMFPKNENENSRLNRHKAPKEKFHVQMALKERLKTSAIPYMQRLLNQHQI